MWNKVGLIYDQPAQLPTVEQIGEDKLRIYHSQRANGQSHIHYIDVDQHFKVVNEGHLLAPGSRGLFDDCGVMPSSIIKHAGRTFMFYTGWSAPNGQVPYGHAIGILEKRDGEWKRSLQGPIVSRCSWCPYLANSAYVIYDQLLEHEQTNCSHGYRMYFCRGQGWNDDFPTYSIGMAVAENIMGPWRWVGSVAGNMHSASSRPCLALVGKEKHLYFSQKEKETTYKIHCYVRQKSSWDVYEDIIEKSESGWDSEMVCYPYIYHWRGETYMFYNGNGYGETGIGLAIWNEKNGLQRKRVSS